MDLVAMASTGRSSSGGPVFARPRFKASFAVVPVNSQSVFLLDEHRQLVLEGEIYPLLAPLLDGEHSVSDIVREIGTHATLYEILFALGRLEERGFIVEGDGTGPQHDATGAFLEYFHPAEGGGTHRYRKARIEVQTTEGMSARAMRDALEANGLEAAAVGDLQVVVTDDYLRPELESINDQALKSGRPWMLVKPLGIVLWIGPIFVPGETGCWACLAQRLRANRQMEKYILDHRGHNGGPVVISRAQLPATVELGLNLAATEVAKWLLAPRTAALAGSMISLDLYTRDLKRHILVKRPQCAQCGDGTFRMNDVSRPIVLSSQTKRFRADGGHRTLTPEQTFARYQHHIGPILGAVTELRPAFGPRCDLTHSYVAGHNFSMGLDAVVFLRESLRGVSGGKGSTEIQAKVSGLCEALERYSGIYLGDEYSIRGTYDYLKPRSIHPNECMGFSDEQYRGREEWNASQPASRCVLVPHCFDPNLEVDWSPIWSLTNHTYRYLPTAFAYYGHPEFRGRWCSPDSNGCAAGNTIEEAILQGFMELVERDSVALWWYNRVRRRGVDLESFHLTYLKAIAEYYASIGRQMWVLDITSDLGIPTFACVSPRTGGPTEDVLVGFGSHFDAQVAVLRAITEVNQFLPSVSLKNPDGSTRYLFGDELARHWWTTARIADLDYLVPDAAQASATCDDFEDVSGDDLLTDVQLCVERAKEHGLEVLVLDQTRPDIGLSVVRVVVPGLCHFWRRFGQPRLFDVPVKMGWLEQPLRADQLNPYSIFF